MLAKWLDEKLKPISINKFMINDAIAFANDLRNVKLEEGELLVLYGVSSLFTNVPVDETIQILVDNALYHNWFNRTYHLKLKKSELMSLLNLAMKNQLFQLNGKLYKQEDGVAVGSPLGPLMANNFMCSIEENCVSSRKSDANIRILSSLR